MNLATQKPNEAKAVADTRRLLDRLFDDPFRGTAFSTAFLRDTGPAMDLYEKEGFYHVKFAAPGLRKENIGIEVVGNRLTVSGRYVHDKEEEEGARYHYREIGSSEFSRTVEFPVDIDADNVQASYDGGVLKIGLKPLKSLESKKITVK